MDSEILQMLKSSSKPNYEEKKISGIEKENSPFGSETDICYLETKIKQWIEKYSSLETLKKKPFSYDHKKFIRINIFIDHCDM
jgi:hypothetical protein